METTDSTEELFAKNLVDASIQIVNNGLKHSAGQRDQERLSSPEPAFMRANTVDTQSSVHDSNSELAQIITLIHENEKLRDACRVQEKLIEELQTQVNSYQVRPPYDSVDDTVAQEAQKEVFAELQTLRDENQILRNQFLHYDASGNSNETLRATNDQLQKEVHLLGTEMETQAAVIEALHQKLSEHSQLPIQATNVTSTATSGISDSDKQALLKHLQETQTSLGALKKETSQTSHVVKVLQDDDHHGVLLKNEDADECVWCFAHKGKLQIYFCKKNDFGVCKLDSLRTWIESYEKTKEVFMIQNPEVKNIESDSPVVDVVITEKQSQKRVPYFFNPDQQVGRAIDKLLDGISEEIYGHEAEIQKRHDEKEKERAKVSEAIEAIEPLDPDAEVVETLEALKDELEREETLNTMVQEKLEERRQFRNEKINSRWKSLINRRDEKEQDHREMLLHQLKSTGQDRQDKFDLMEKEFYQDTQDRISRRRHQVEDMIETLRAQRKNDAELILERFNEAEEEFLQDEANTESLQTPNFNTKTRAVERIIERYKQKEADTKDPATPLGLKQKEQALNLSKEAERIEQQVNTEAQKLNSSPFVRKTSEFMSIEELGDNEEGSLGQVGENSVSSQPFSPPVTRAQTQQQRSFVSPFIGF